MKRLLDRKYTVTVSLSQENDWEFLQNKDAVFASEGKAITFIIWSRIWRKKCPRVASRGDRTMDPVLWPDHHKSASLSCKLIQEETALAFCRDKPKLFWLMWRDSLRYNVFCYADWQREKKRLWSVLKMKLKGGRHGSFWFQGLPPFGEKVWTCTQWVQLVRSMDHVRPNTTFQETLVLICGIYIMLLKCKIKKERKIESFMISPQRAFLTKMPSLRQCQDNAGTKMRDKELVIYENEKAAADAK